MIVDERTGCRFSLFTHTKSGMVEPTCAQLAQWIQQGKNICVLRMDNGGENVKLAQRVKSAEWQLPIRFEFTARGVILKLFLM